MTGRLRERSNTGASGEARRPRHPHRRSPARGQQSSSSIDQGRDRAGRGDPPSYPDLPVIPLTSLQKSDRTRALAAILTESGTDPTLAGSLVSQGWDEERLRSVPASEHGRIADLAQVRQLASEVVLAPAVSRSSSAPSNAGLFMIRGWQSIRRPGDGDRGQSHSPPPQDHGCGGCHRSPRVVDDRGSGRRAEPGRHEPDRQRSRLPRQPDRDQPHR